jgi:GINS complex subunit 4
MASEKARLLAELEADEYSAFPYGKKDYHTLLQQFTNETMSPTILQFETDSVRRLLDALSSQEIVIENEMDHFVRVLYQMEYDRVKFLLSSYLRARLLKIERYAKHIVSNDHLLERLSEKERRFHENYLKLEDDTLRSGNFLKNLEDQVLDEGDKNYNTPNNDQFVFCRVLQDIGRVQFDEDDEGNAVNLNRGDTYILSYDSIKSLVDDRIKLV